MTDKEMYEQFASLIRAAQDYSKAYKEYLEAYDEVEEVRGLDEFDPKHVDWKRKLFFAEEKMAEEKRNLLDIAIKLEHV